MTAAWIWWLALAACFAAGAVAVCAAHIPVLRVLTGAAPLTDDHTDGSTQ